MVGKVERFFFTVTLRSAVTATTTVIITTPPLSPLITSSPSLLPRGRYLVRNIVRERYCVQTSNTTGILLCTIDTIFIFL